MMSIWTHMKSVWGEDGGSEELVRAQYTALMRQVPLMYTMLLVNLISPAILFYDLAPFVLTVTVPLLLGSIFAIRAVSMYRNRNRIPGHAEILRIFRGMRTLAVFVSISLASWAIALFLYADDLLKGQIISFVGISLLTAVTCVMPLRQVALILFTVMVTPISVFLLTQDNPVFHGVAVNLFIIMIVMLNVMLRSNADFRERVEKQVQLDTQRRELEALNLAVRKIVDEDNLTGLPNRRSFFHSLHNVMQKAHATRTPFAVGLIDLDGFKPVNDLMGYQFGDKLLTEVANRLRAAAPDDMVIARVGGDEFGIIVPIATDDGELRRICEKVVVSLEPDFQLMEGSATLRGTCGIARCTGDTCSSTELFERATFALHHGKNSEPGTVSIFSDHHARAIKDAMAIGKRLREADLDEVLKLEYQPIVESGTGRTLGVEALARWTDPVLGRVRPDVFIKAAEQTGLIGKVTTTLFNKALAEAVRWPEDNYLSFNLSALDICSQETMTSIFAAIGRSNISPRRLVFEITESSVMQNFDRALHSLQLLKAAGCHIALDDFGTGYSSLSYVRRLPIDRVKVDASFLQGIEQDKVSFNLVKTISEMCENLNLQCILEGVETQNQIELLNDIGCTAYQGYLFARPMPPDTLEAWRQKNAAVELPKSAQRHSVA